MKNNKGFTLIELIAVITILAIVALITVPIVNKAIIKSKEKALEAQKETIVDAAKKYALGNTDILPKTDLGEKLIHISDLITGGYLEEKPIDPVTNKEMSDCVLVTYDQTKNKYTYKYSECKINLPTENIYPNGDRLLYIFDESTEDQTTVNGFFGTYLDGITLSPEDNAILQKYNTENIYGINNSVTLVFDASDKAIDAMHLMRMRVEKEDMYIDFYYFLSDVAKLFNTKLGYNAMYLFSDPEKLTLYFGFSMMTTMPHEDPDHLADVQNELAIFSNKNVHTASDACDAYNELYMAQTPAPTDPFECPFASYSVTEIEMDQ